MQRPPSSVPGLSWGPSHTLPSLSLLFLHTAVWRNTDSHSCLLQGTPDHRSTTNRRKLKVRFYYLNHKWHKNPKMHADLWVTLVLQHAVETLGLQAAGMLVCWLAVASLNFWQVGHVHLNFPHRLVGLTGKQSSHRISNNPENMTIKTYNHLLVFPSAHLDELVGWWFARIAVLL